MTSWINSNINLLIYRKSDRKTYMFGLWCVNVLFDVVILKNRKYAVLLKFMYQDNHAEGRKLWSTDFSREYLHWLLNSNNGWIFCRVDLRIFILRRKKNSPPLQTTFSAITCTDLAKPSDRAGVLTRETKTGVRINQRAVFLNRTARNANAPPHANQLGAGECGVQTGWKGAVLRITLALALSTTLFNHLSCRHKHHTNRITNSHKPLITSTSKRSLSGSLRWIFFSLILENCSSSSTLNLIQVLYLYIYIVQYTVTSFVSNFFIW